MEQITQSVNKTYFKCYVIIKGVAPRCRKIDRHIVNLKGFQEVSTKPSNEDLQAIVSAAKTLLQGFKNVTQAEIKLSFTTLNGAFEQTELFDSKHQTIPLT